MDKDSLTDSSLLDVNVKRAWLQAGVVFTLFSPLFFQLQGTVYTFQGMNFDAGDVLAQVPLPISVLTTLIGLVFLVRYRQATQTVAVLFAFFMLMLFSTFISSSQTSGLSLGKLILLLQFVLPLFALVLGQSYVRPKKSYLRFEAVVLYVLVLVVPAQVILSCVNKTGTLSPDLYIFAIYQHLQYVPVIFVGLFFLALSALNGDYLLGLLAVSLAPFMGVYTALSLSILAISLSLISCASIFFLSYKFKRCGFASVSVLIFIISLFACFSTAKSTEVFERKFEVVESSDLSSTFLKTIWIRSDVNKSMQSWHLYLDGVLEGAKEFILGHSARPEKESVASAHNYYLDLMYNFGAIALMPFIYLIFFTLQKFRAIIKSGENFSEIWWLGGTVLFFVLVDNFFKVGLRQPYPGIITFFLWGVLLSKISEESISSVKGLKSV